MTPIQKLLTASALSLVLAACSNSESANTVTDTPPAAAPAEYVPVTYDVEGQTDEDHIWAGRRGGRRGFGQSA